MSLPIVYRRQVGRDLAAGFGRYEEQTKGLGEWSSWPCCTRLAIPESGHSLEGLRASSTPQADAALERLDLPSLAGARGWA